jgi:isoleucyl-tRNA synthetase
VARRGAREKWQVIRDVRRVVTGSLEKARERKEIGSSLQAAPTIYVDSAAKTAELLPEDQWNELFITSAHAFSLGDVPAEAFRLPEVPGVAVVFAPAAGEKCQRCWKVLPEVGRHAHHAMLCVRCADAVDQPAAG